MYGKSACPVLGGAGVQPKVWLKTSACSQEVPGLLDRTLTVMNCTNSPALGIRVHTQHSRCRGRSVRILAFLRVQI